MFPNRSPPGISPKDADVDCVDGEGKVDEMFKVGPSNTGKHLSINEQINQDLLQCRNTLLLVFYRRLRDQLSNNNIEVRSTYLINHPFQICLQDHVSEPFRPDPFKDHPLIGFLYFDQCKST